MDERTVDSINTLVRFCARRDGPVLTREAVRSVAGAPADVAILFGGTIMAGADVLAGAMRLINCASHQTTVTLTDGQLTYATPPAGMWPVDRYVTLLMGEVPRLTDDARGYGPAGRGYIAHVDVPPEVRRAFTCLRDTTGFATRVADAQWAG